MTRSLRVFPARVLVAMAVFVHGCAHQQATSRGTTVTTDGLSGKQQRLVALAAFTANGNLPKLSTALEGLRRADTSHSVRPSTPF